MFINTIILPGETNMTSNAVITVLMALGMSFDDADSSFDIYCDFYDELPHTIADIKAMWWLYGKTEIRNTTHYDKLYFQGE